MARGFLEVYLAMAGILTLLGAAIGMVVTKQNRKRGAIIGAIVGLLVGSIVTSAITFAPSSPSPTPTALAE